MNHLYRIATDSKRPLDERWEALHKMLSQKQPADIQKILKRTSERRRRRTA